MPNDAPMWDEATRAVSAASSLVLITHVNPDGDAIGSLLGLANALRAMGKVVDAVVDGGVPDDLRFVTGSETVLPVLASGEWDLMISLDASDERRTGVAGVYGRAHSRAMINVDHHPTNTRFGDIHLVIPTAVSTTEILLEWLTRMGVELTPPVAQPLLTGLVTDTRGFRTSNVRPDTLALAQRLMEAGASLTEIAARALDTIPYSYVELWKYVLPSVELTNTVISATITQADLRQAGIEETTNGDLVNMLISVEQAMIAATFTEQPSGEVEISLRSKPGFDVSQVALSVGGGGHRQAAGATIPGPIEAAKARVLPLLYEAAAQGTLSIA